MEPRERQAILARFQGDAQRFDQLAARRSRLHRVPGPADTVPVPAPVRRLDREITAREHEVLQFVSDGLSNREIGELLFLSEETIKSHLRNILAKLQARSRAHAVAIGFRSGLIE